MASLTIDGSTVSVAAGGLIRQKEDTATYRRRFTGAMDVETRSDFGRVRVWRVRTVPMARASATTLATALLASGTRTVAGDLASPSATCYVRNLSREDGPTDSLAALAFELHEVSG